MAPRLLSVCIAALLISGCAFKRVSPSEFEQEVDSLNLIGSPFEVAVKGLQEKGYECQWDSRTNSPYYMKTAFCSKRGTFELTCPQRLNVSMTLEAGTHAVEKVDARQVEKACW